MQQKLSLKRAKDKTLRAQDCEIMSMRWKNQVGRVTTDLSKERITVRKLDIQVNKQKIELMQSVSKQQHEDLVRAKESHHSQWIDV